MMMIMIYIIIILCNQKYRESFLKFCFWLYCSWRQTETCGRLVNMQTTIKLKMMLQKSNPCTGLGRHLKSSRTLSFPEFLENQHMKVVRLSALRTGRLYPPGNACGTHFC
jgi:hypothetical protein